MAKEFKRTSKVSKDDNGKKRPAPAKKSRTEKKDDKPAFDRYRDESRPSDLGTGRRSSSSGTGRGKGSGSSRSGGKSESRPTRSFTRDSEKPERKEHTERPERRSSGERKPFRAPSARPAKREANPYDLDESDLEYGKEKPAARSFRKEPSGKGFSRKAGKGPKPKENKERNESEGIRLNKYIANAGICSRREADDLIASGVVQVNGKTITEMGFRVKPTDIIKYGGQTLKKERLVYLILNKPKDYITTVDDPEKRRTVLELVQDACRERIYPVGRLDRSTTGLLMFTNDGELTKKMTHPRYGVRKIYHVELDKPLKRQDLDKIAGGLELEDGEIHVDEISYVGDQVDKRQVGVEIHSGKNRIVRRIFESLGYNVRKLDRVMFGPLTKKDLPRGRWRFLTEAEVGMLKMIGGDN
jgi:23S rRNA pseudouridine2605 synthase